MTSPIESPPGQPPRARGLTGALESREPGLFYGLLLAVLFETTTLFWFTRKVGKALFYLVHGGS